MYMCFGFQKCTVSIYVSKNIIWSESRPGYFPRVAVKYLERQLYNITAIALLFPKTTIGLKVIRIFSKVQIQIFETDILSWHSYGSSGSRDVWFGVHFPKQNGRSENLEIFTSAGIQIFLNPIASYHWYCNFGSRNVQSLLSSKIIRLRVFRNISKVGIQISNCYRHSSYGARFVKLSGTFSNIHQSEYIPEHFNKLDFQSFLYTNTHARYSYMLSSCKTIFNQILFFQVMGNSLSWSYGSWIYNCLCNQCLSPRKLWVESRSWRSVLDTKFVNDLLQVGGFLWILRFTPLLKLTITI